MAIENDLLGRILGPTDAQYANQMRLKEARRLEKQRDSKDLYTGLVNSGIVIEDDEANVLKIDYDKLFEQNESGGYKYSNQIERILNSTDTFGQYLDTKEGKRTLKDADVVQGKIKGFAPGTTEGTIAILNERPDTKVLRPKTWFASDDPSDYTAELTREKMEALIEGNVDHAYHLSFGERKAQSDRVRRQAEIQQESNFGAGTGDTFYDASAADRGARIEQIDSSDNDLTDRNSALLEVVGEIEQSIIQRNQEAEASRDQFGSISKDFVGGSNMPWKTVDTSSEGAKKGYEVANEILNADPNTSFTEEEVISMIKNAGVRAKEPFQNELYKSLGYNSMAGKDWLNLPRLLQRKEFLEAQPDDYTELGKKKTSLITGGTSSVTGASMGREPTKTKEQLIQEVDNRIANGNEQLRNAARVTKREYEKDDKAIKDYAEDKLRKPREQRLEAINKLLNGKAPLSAGRREELEKEKNKIEKELSTFRVSSVAGVKPLTALPEADENGNYNQEQLKNWFRTNEESFKAIGGNGEAQEKLRNIIREYQVETLEDLTALDFESDEVKQVAGGDGNGLSLLDSVAILAITSDLPFEEALESYQRIFTKEAERQDKRKDAAFDREIKLNEYQMKVNEYRQGQREYLDGLGDDFRQSYLDLIDIIYGEDGEGKFNLRDDAQQAKIRGIVTKLETLPGAPKFIFKNGRYQVIEGATPEITLAMKDIAGQLFKAIVDTEGSVDWRDGWGDWLAGNDPNGLARLVDEIRYTRNADGGIQEVFFTAPGNSIKETEGSLKPPDIGTYFGPEGQYLRNFLLSVISEYGQAIDDF
jgi:hypothetical protein